MQIDDAKIRECTKCGGLWCGIEAFEDLCASKEQQTAVLGFIADRSDRSVQSAAISYVPCPDCKQLMNRSNIAHASGVIIDLCKKHGVWFDASELPKIIEFITGGGMQRAREKNKIEIQDERARLRDEERRLATISRRSGGSPMDDYGREPDFGGIIWKLFGL